MRALFPFVALLIAACSGSTDDDSPSASGGSAGKGSQGGGANSGGTAGSSSAGASSGGGSSAGTTGTGGTAGTAGVTGDPPGTCEAPALVDTSSPDHVIGDGTPGSCTAAALQAAADLGGAITFDCGPDPLTIMVSSTVIFAEDTVVDGGGLVTLSGGGGARIFYLDSGYDQTTPRLTVQRLGFTQGKSTATGEDTADGGAAIYRDGGSLTVIDCDFTDNHAPASGQDLAGGAIYGFGGGETIIADSTFTDNSASDGGAVGSLNGDVTIINSTFSGNAATGTKGNPGDGGCGGAIYMDGGDETTTLCGVTISDNTAGAIGGGFFRVSNSDDGTFIMDKTSVSGNVVTPDSSGNAGGLYLQGLAITITASTIANNQAFYNGGIWISEATADLTNVTIAENTAFGSNGGGMWLAYEPTGTMLNCTIANNHSTAESQVAGAIFGGGLTLKNTLIAGNTAMYTPGCDATHDSGGGNLQWPDGALCSDSPTLEDPELGMLADNGGPTKTMLPAGSSAAVELGSGCPATDQRGEPRGEPCTAGAVEVQ